MGADTFTGKVKQGMESIEGKPEKNISSVLSVVDEIKEKLIAFGSEMKKPPVSEEVLRMKPKEVAKSQPLRNRWTAFDSVESRNRNQKTQQRLEHDSNESKSSPKLSSTVMPNH